MKVQFVGKNINIRDNFKDETQKKINRLDKYFVEEPNTTVTMSTEGSEKRVEITIRVMGSGTILRADQTSYDMLQSVDRCIDSLVSQVRKNKTKLRKKHQGGGESIRFEQIEDLPEEEKEGDLPDISRIKHLDLAPMSAEEACLQMELLNHDFFLFVDAETNEVNLVYKRKAGDYGLLIPNR